MNSSPQVKFDDGLITKPLAPTIITILAASSAYGLRYVPLSRSSVLTFINATLHESLQTH